MCGAHVRSSDLTSNPERQGIKTGLTLEEIGGLPNELRFS